MQSTLTSSETDPHDIFVIEPDVVLAARADRAPYPIRSVPEAPPIQPAPSVTVADATLHAPANDDIQIPRDIRVSGEKPARRRWAARTIIGFLFAICSAAAAEGWNHYGDKATATAKAVIANWTPSALASPPAEAAGTTAQPGASAAAADTASVPAAQSAQGPTSQNNAPIAATDAAPVPAQDVASMGQQIAALKASIEQLKASQDQMAQQLSRDATRTPLARTSPAKPSAAPVEQSLHAKVTAALSQRPVAPPPPPRKPRSPYPPAQTAATLQPATTSAMPPQPAPPPYQPRLQAIDQSDGDPVVRPPMPVR